MRRVDFDRGKSVVFHQDLAQQRYIPWEVKETTVKNFLGVFGMNIIDFLFSTSNMFYSMGALAFGLNWFYRVYAFMGYAITKIELHEDGKTVTVTFKTGGTKELKIKDIMKKEHEKTLVQTFEECYLFPIEVHLDEKRKVTYYIYGQGQEPIKNGEIFRAIING